jgi:L-arabinose isomerase
VLVTVGDDTAACKSDLGLRIAEVELDNLVERIRDIEESLSVG